MNRLTDKPMESQTPPPADPARLGRILFLIASGILFGTLVSCACSPMR